MLHSGSENASVAYIIEQNKLSITSIPVTRKVIFKIITLLCVSVNSSAIEFIKTNYQVIDYVLCSKGARTPISIEIDIIVRNDDD